MTGYMERFKAKCSIFTPGIGIHLRCILELGDCFCDIITIIVQSWLVHVDKKNDYEAT